MGKVRYRPEQIIPMLNEATMGIREGTTAREVFGELKMQRHACRNRRI